mgnify:CR=1 FL=1
MGGSFDPIHYGHLVAASEAAHRFDLARVIFCPTGQAWHKSTDRRAPAEVRYLMTVVATAADPRFDVSRVDIDRPGPTYTVDTLRDLRDERADAGLPAAEWPWIAMRSLRMPRALPVPRTNCTAAFTFCSGWGNTGLWMPGWNRW